jgi:hypothetical protein
MFRIFGIIAGAISLAILLWKGFHFTFDPDLVQVLQFCDDTMGRAFAVFEPWIRESLEWLGTRFGWQLHLYPHWKHLFVLMWLCFGSIALQQAALVSARFPRRAQHGLWVQGFQSELALVGVFWSLFASFLSALTAGTIDLDGANATWLIPLCTLAGYTLTFLAIDAYVATYNAAQIGDRWTSRFWRLFKDIPQQVLIGSMLIGLSAQANHLAFLGKVPNGGRVVLSTLVMLMALWSLGRGVIGGGLLGRAASPVRSLGREMAAEFPMSLEHRSGGRGRKAKTTYFDRSADRGAEPSVAVIGPAGQGALKGLQIEALLPAALIVLGALLLCSLSFW